MTTLDENVNTGVAIPGEDVPVTQTEAPAVVADANPEIEDRARAQGWVPKDDFKGPAEKWKPADEFVKHGEETLPILRERLRALERDKSTLANQVQAEQRQRQQDFTRLERMNEIALKRQRDQLFDNYEAAKLNAAASADVERYQQLNRDQIAAVRAHDDEVAKFSQPVAQNPASPYSPSQQQVLGTWQERNPWFVSDPEMKAVAVLYSQRLADQTPGITLEENLAQVEQYARQRYPEKFPAKRPASSGPAVEGGSRSAAAPSRGRSAADLPAEAKRAFDKWVKEGLYKPNEINQYAKEYFEQ